MKLDQFPIQKGEGKSKLNGTIVDTTTNGQITESKTLEAQSAVPTDLIDIISGPGDLLVEDTNATRNAENESPYENGNKLDDSTSLSSSSSNLANIELEDDLSDDMTLRISEDEDGGAESKKDSLQYASFPTSPMPTADNPPLSENCSSNSQFDNLNKISDPPVVNQIQESKESKSGTSNHVAHTNSMQIDAISSDSFDLKEINENSANVKDISRPETDEKSLDNETNSSEIPSETVESNSDLTISELRQEIEDFIKCDDTDQVASPKLLLTPDEDKKESSLDLNEVPMDVNSNLDSEAVNKDISDIEVTKSTTPDLDVNPKENTSTNTINDEKAASGSDSNTSDILLHSEPEIELNTSVTTLEDSSNNSDNTKMNEEHISVSNETEHSSSQLKQTSTESADATSQDSVPKMTEISSYVANEPESDESNDLLVPMEVEPIESDNLNEETSEEGTSSPVDKSSETSETVADVTSSLLEVLRETGTSEDVMLETNGKSVISEELNTSLGTAIESLEKEMSNESMDTEISENTPEQVSENKAEIDISEESFTATMDLEAKLIDNKDMAEKSEVDTSKTDDVAKQVMEDGKADVKMDAESVDNANETIKDELKEDNSKELNGTVKSSVLKRSHENTEEEDSDAKKLKFNGSLMKTCETIKKIEYVTLAQFKQFMDKRQIEFMSRDELEEFVLQKMCEVVNQDSRIAELSRAIRLHEQRTDILRNRFGIMAKQVKDLEIVHTRIIQEVRTKAKEGGNIKEATPVKITRSVGLQVSLQPIAPVRIRPGPEPDPSVRIPPVAKRRNYRASLPSKLPTTPPFVQPLGPPVAPAPKPVASSPKPVASSPKPPSAVTSGATKGIKTILPKVYSAAIPKGKDAQTNGPVLANYLQKPTAQTSPIRKTIETPKVIDLTDEEDTNKATISIPTSNIRVIASHQLTNTINTPSTATVTSVANTNLPRLTYFVQTPGQPGQPVLLATSSAPTRPGQPRPTLMFKPVPSGQVPSGQRLNLVRPAGPGTINVLQSNATQNIRPGQQIRYTSIQTAQSQQSVVSRSRHPAPLPGPPAVQPSQPNWKAMPPKPNLKISRVGDGIVLSWKMLNKDMARYEDIASYQLYAYQETNGAPSTDMWRKVGDVKALALPMACTLTQFTDGNKYHFAVRAVDVKSRVGPFSPPEQIALP